MFTLEDVLDSYKEISKNITSSKNLIPVLTNMIFYHNNNAYEVRYFLFQTLKPKQKLYEFCEKYNLLEMKPTVKDCGYSILHIFDYRKNGDYFTLSLRKKDD